MVRFHPQNRTLKSKVGVTAFGHRDWSLQCPKLGRNSDRTIFAATSAIESRKSLAAHHIVQAVFSHVFDFERP